MRIRTANRRRKRNLEWCKPFTEAELNSMRAWQTNAYAVALGLEDYSVISISDLSKLEGYCPETGTFIEYKTIKRNKDSVH